MYVITVVRNMKMYESLVRKNSFYTNSHFIFFDNTIENIGISKRYNDFLDSYDFDNKNDWFVFCHEDWELKEPLECKLNKLNPSFIYGVCGTFYNNSKNKIFLYGNIDVSNKDGTNLISQGISIKKKHVVDTFDCQCLIVHSTLVQNFNLRFDENLNFDLYTEDFSIKAMEQYNIKSFVFPLKCHHYSYGNTGTSSFRKCSAYIRQKYQDCKKLYSTCCLESLKVLSPPPRICCN